MQASAGRYVFHTGHLVFTVQVVSIYLFMETAASLFSPARARYFAPM